MHAELVLRSSVAAELAVRSQEIWIEVVPLTWDLSVLLGRVGSRAAQWIWAVLRLLERELRPSHLFCRTARPWLGVFQFGWDSSRRAS